MRSSTPQDIFPGAIEGTSVTTPANGAVMTV